MFKAVYLTRPEDQVLCEIKELEDDALPEGDVTVRVGYSTVNYKDGLAVTGKMPVVRSYPMVPGIDFAGTVEESSNSDFEAGDQVVLNGWGIGEKHWGGLAQKARVQGDWLIKLPEAFTPAQAMSVGTAGYTAMLCVLALEKGGITPDDGDILVTGAAGGVGSVAISVLSKLGYRVVASTGRVEAEGDYLRDLGAADIIDRATLSEPGRPLGKETWAGAVDAVGSHTLANVLAQTKYGGTVACCGMAQGLDLPGSVAPFILRGVSLIGIDSVMAPKAVREEAWGRLATDLDTAKLEELTRTVGLDEAPAIARDITDGKIRGRVVVDVNG